MAKVIVRKSDIYKKNNGTRLARKKTSFSSTTTKVITKKSNSQSANVGKSNLVVNSKDGRIKKYIKDNNPQQTQ